MGNRLLCTCPSRGRPELLRRMIDSFNKTRASNTDLVVYVDDDDPRLDEYKSDYIMVGKRMNVAQIHNHLVAINPGYDYYMPINDDVTFESPNWDEILIEAIESKGDGWGISFGNDTTGNHKHSLPTFGMMSGNIVKTLGYFYPLELKMLNGDIFLLDIGRAIGKLYYCPNVVIKHSPPGVASGAFVPNDHRSSAEFAKQDTKAYADYIDNNLDRDIAKIFDAICVAK